MDDYKKYLEIAKQRGISHSAYANRVNKLKMTPKEAAYKPSRKRSSNKLNENIEVAMYKGDQFFIWGTISEVSEKLEMPKGEIRQRCSPSWRKKLEDSGTAIYGIYIED